MSFCFLHVTDAHVRSLHSTSNLVSKNISLRLTFPDKTHGHECCDRLLLQILYGIHPLSRPESAFQANSQRSCHSFKQHLTFKPGKSILICLPTHNTGNPFENMIKI